MSPGLPHFQAGFVHGTKVVEVFIKNCSTDEEEIIRSYTYYN